jgi:hypothetical protein
MNCIKMTNSIDEATNSIDEATNSIDEATNSIDEATNTQVPRSNVRTAQITRRTQMHLPIPCISVNTPSCLQILPRLAHATVSTRQAMLTTTSIHQRTCIPPETGPWPTHSTLPRRISHPNVVSLSVSLWRSAKREGGPGSTRTCTVPHLAEGPHP